KLLRLVKLHGERKWAHIAEQMICRARKQCRERWHNHLRPD
ncbi:transcription factor MYB98, partial [Tanacetum coccineum]